MEIGGYGWEKAGHIWYDTLRDPRPRPNTGFRRFAKLTLNSAEKLFGLGSVESKAVRNVWNQVGIKIT